MITARLNRLLKAYRIAKQLFGEANKGRVVPGPAFRWCHKVRQAVWAEIERVRQLIPRIRAAKLKKENQHMANEIGESLGAVYSRADDMVMTRVITALQEGGRLRIDSFIRKAVVEGMPDRDFRNGTTITLTRLKKLVEQGVLQEIALDRYAINPDFELQPLKTNGA